VHSNQILAFALLVSSASFACSSTSSTGGSPATADAAVPVKSDSGAPTAGPGPGEFKADYKTSALFMTNMKAAVKGTSPHGTARIWYSSNIKDLLEEDAFTAPEGTTVIKEFDMTGDGTRTGIAVMIKKPKGYDAANGDWYYDMRDMAGNVMPDPPAGKIGMCISCHTGYKATDYLAGTTLR
jgi:hypothetical protein